MSPMPMSESLRQRWRYHKKIAQADLADDSDYRPTGRVFVTRGHMRHHPTPNINSGKFKRGDWDEKWTWGGQPGEFMRRKAGNKTTGLARDSSVTGPVELPYVSQINIRNSLEQNGIANATVTITNQEWEEKTDGATGFIYHLLREGFFGPSFYGDDDTFLFDEDDQQLGDDSRKDFSQNTNTINGKRISGLLLPNRKLEIFQGYGDEVQRTFVGLIDSVDISSNPAQITIQATDFGKTLSTYTYHPRFVERYPVSFGDKRYWKAQAKAKNIKQRRQWGTKLGVPGNVNLVNDLTEIVGYILGWGGFWSYRTIRAGRIGSAHRDRLGGNIKHNAIFKDENFDKGSYFIDGLNMVKELLGYVFYVTPEFAPDKPLADRFTDPDFYNASNSKYSTGMPYFVPHNIWVDDPNAEQVTDDDILLNSSLTYDLTDIRKNIYLVNTGLINRKNRPRRTGYSSPHTLMSGVEELLVIDVEESYGIKLGEREAKVLMRMIALASMFTFAKGSFSVAGYPGATINDQIHVSDRSTGQWRRFFIAGFDSTMTLGPRATYQTTFQAAQMDNIYVRRIKREIEELTGFDTAVKRTPFTRPTSRTGT